jgi:hypothetical protein
MVDINPPSSPDEYDYFNGKRTDRIYVSKSFKPTDLFDLDEPKYLRILSKVFDSGETCQYAQVNKEIVLRVTASGRQEVKIVFFEDSREIKHITIQRFTKKGGKPHRNGFSFNGKEIEKLYDLLRLVRYINLENGEKVRLDDSVLDELLISEEEKRKYLIDNLDLVKEISEQHITKSDVIAFAYRKQQLDIFALMLNDQQYFDSKKVEWGVRGDEAIWQKFFEENPWIFGYGLNYIFTSQFDNKKLEQVTTGFSFLESGKRADALMKTRGLISSLCFVEIKTHKTHLLQNESYRSECWPISNELCGSVAQVQKTVQKALKSIQTKIEVRDEDGNPTGETAFLFQPKSFIVIGCLDEFIINNGINEQKFGSFELFRRNIHNPEIITFDELYERAKFIVKLSEEENASIKANEFTCAESSSDEISEGEIPF